MQKLSVSLVVMSALVLSACVSESTYVGSERPVQQRQVDNTEAARTRMSLGLNYLQRGENAQAIFNLERARALAPQLPEVYNALAYYYQSVNEPEQAEAAYKQALARDANNPDTYNNYGAFLCQQGKYHEAEVLLLNAIRRPGYMRVSESYENLALCQLQQNNFSRAQHYLESAVLHSGNRISSLLNLAGLDYAMGNHQRARQHLTRIQRLGHVSASTSLLSYLIADKELDSETQRNSQELLLQVYPDSEAARLMRQGRLQDSEYEQLRERYKQYLISNLELPAPAAQPEAEVEQPQIRIVRRSEPRVEPEVARQSQSLTRSRPNVVTTASPIVDATEAADEANSITEASLNQVVLAAPSWTMPELPAESVDPATTALELERLALPELALDITQVVEPNWPAESSRTQMTQHGVTENIAEPMLETELSALASVHTPGIERELAEPLESDTLSDDSSLATAAAEYDEVASHIVQQGESLFAISMRYNIRLERLQQWNQLSPGATIRAGQRLWLAEPPEQLPVQAVVAVERPDVHVVAEGDTLFNISMRYNVRLARLLNWNNLTERSRVYIGQRIYLKDPADVSHDD
ncbi:type IV pilus biogenesis/stability protein PilW [Alkalimonas amylolytica]|uniref:Type IV pilus biogenesis/stability protein PilW n=1 Tax=Alkalimonas amylolytica TaxID=152573 RepID=A0A1H3X4J0_ALKAM|nr:type IV pilus biogenesis/stability protein PilW [Alkalimonas amylolytica]SDZ94325.1 type IV pilus biogenesis/stability protein PilW [Alkalimonas amylolytica]